MSWTTGSWPSETSWSFNGQEGSGGSSPENMGECVTACGDEIATNYNAEADIIDNTLCEYALVQGCMDAIACNFDEAAEQDNGTCEYADEGFDCEGGCLEGVKLTMTDSYGDGWGGNILTINDVDYTIETGASATACVAEATCYLMSWTTGSWPSETSWSFNGQEGSGGSSPENMGECLTACGDENATNYNVDADIVDDTLCEYDLVQGCVDATACNYDAAAEQDNGTCEYPPTGFDCAGTCLVDTVTATMSDSYGDGWSGNTIDIGEQSATLETGSTGTHDFCLDLTQCNDYTVGGGSYLSEISWTIGDDISGAGEGSGTIGTCVTGCSDENATNYNVDADIVDDTLCEYAPEGMVFVPAGDFLYGDPATSINLQDSFYIDQYEVTAGDYKSCVDAGECQYNGSTTSDSRTYDNGKDDHPINYVNWDEASTYCVWKNKRLPTEQEWEKAARGTDGRTYPWGEDAPDGTRSNYHDSGDAFDNGTTPVGYYNGENDGTVNSPSPYNAYDMAGNVWEWTSSWHSDAESYRVLRGGSFGGSAFLESSFRSYDAPDTRVASRGFRCAQ